MDLLQAIQAWNDVKKSTIVDCSHEAVLMVALGDGCLDNDDDTGCLESEFCELSAFPGSFTACDFVSADISVQALADHAGTDIVGDNVGTKDADSSSSEDYDEESQPPCTAFVTQWMALTLLTSTNLRTA